MYFKSRTHAGKQLADQLQSYRYEDSAVLALTEGGVVVGAQIAAVLHCPLMFLLMQDIVLPGEKTALGVVDQSGGFTYNDYFSAGELDAFASEYHGLIEQLKQQKWHELNKLLSDGGLVDPAILTRRNIIVVSDGFMSGESLSATINFLKPVDTRKIIIVAPLATVTAVDKMHVIADELAVLNVIDDTFDVDHYYDEDDIPPRDSIIKILNEAILRWK